MSRAAEVDNKNKRSWQERNTRAVASSLGAKLGPGVLLAHFQEWIELNVNPQCGLRRERQCLIRTWLDTPEIFSRPMPMYCSRATQHRFLSTSGPRRSGLTLGHPRFKRSARRHCFWNGKVILR